MKTKVSKKVMSEIAQSDLERLSNIDMTPTKKYLSWILKIWVNDKPTFNGLKNLIEEYDVFSNRNRMKSKDINSYKTFKELYNEVSVLNDTGDNLSLKELENDYNLIIDNDDLYIACPNSHEASRKLGLTKFAFRESGNGIKDSAWCTTHKSADHFNSYYYKNECTFYYTKVKSLTMIDKINEMFPSTITINPMTIVAIVVYKNGEIDAYDALDEQISKTKIDMFLNIIGLEPLVFIPINVDNREIKLIQLDNKKIQLYIKNGCIGELDLYQSKITKLPNNLRVINGDLNLGFSNIIELPDNLIVNGNLDLYMSKMTKLPNDLTVNGNLDLAYSQIIELPSNLIVNGDLDLNNTKITKLPNNLRVINGNLNLYDSNIIELPDNLTVKRQLNLSFTEISKLPDNLTVYGNLDIRKSNITELPSTLIVIGQISKDFR